MLAPIDIDLVRHLVDTQFPQWSHLPVRAVDVDGWDNRTFRLGEEFAVRLPSAAGYVPQVRKELEWLPHIASGLSLPVPEVVALGHPDTDYPYEWTVRRWIDGIPVRDLARLDRMRFADDIAELLHELGSLDATRGPGPGPHSAGRGAPLSQWDVEVDSALRLLEDRLDTHQARVLWKDAREATFEGPPRWFHGDVAVGNLLTRRSRLSAVIDFGCSGIGDTACDLTIAWTFLRPEEREAFRVAIDVDDGTWARGRGWALWKALITVDSTDAEQSRISRFTLRQLGIGEE